MSISNLHNELIVPSSSAKSVISTKIQLPKIIDSNKLAAHSKIQWENIMKKKNKVKKKTKVNPVSVMEHAMENVRIVNENSKTKLS